MKTTVLVFIDRTVPQKGLRIATMKEWNEILSNNRGLAMEERRIFYKDCIPEGEEMDCMFIETTYAEFAKEEAERKARYRNEQEKKKCSFVYLSEQFGSVEDELSLEDCIPSDYCLEDDVIGNVMIEELRDALVQWNDWAPELLEKEFLRVLPQLLILLYCGRHGVDVKLNDETTIGILLDVYIPESRLGFVVIDRGTKIERKKLLVTEHLCKARGIKCVCLSLRNDIENICVEIKRALRSIHIYITSDSEEDIKIARQQFERWRNQL